MYKDKSVRFLAGALWVGFGWGGYGQTLVSELKPGSILRVGADDLAVLERQELRNDLPCDVSQVKPELDWDFNFHAGFHGSIPMRHLVGEGNDLTILFRVIPEDHTGDPLYMFQRIHVPPIEKAGKGEKTFVGMFTLGEGKYHVDWLMRDQRGRVCAAFWDLEARLNSKDTQVREWVPKALVQPVVPLFTEEPAILGSKSGLPHVSIIVNFAPPDHSAVKLEDRDVENLVTILRRIGSDPRIQSSIIACSLETQKIFYREDANTIDMPALGQALKSLKFGLVDAKRLASGVGPGEFAGDLIGEHLKIEKPDALIVLGHKEAAGAKVSRQSLDSLENPGTPVFYFSYSSEQLPAVTQDPISSIIKKLRGLEYRLDRPRDLFNAWSEAILRIEKTKQNTQTSRAMKEDTR
jgi:hypothetical protein